MVDDLFSGEEWRPVAAVIPGRVVYEVSSFGRVRSTGPRARVLRQELNRRYYVVSLHGKFRRLVHTLVAAAFVGPKPVGMTVNHIDGHKSNNSSGNLEYLTHRENIRHAFANGLCDSRRGTRHYCNKLSEDSVRAIIAELKRGTSGYALAARYGVSQQTIQKIKHRQRWKHIAR